MSHHPKLAPEDQMTIAEFLGFTQSRPGEERWELTEGVPVMNAAPANWAARDARGLTAALELPALGVCLPLADVYRYTPVGQLVL